MNDLDEGTEGMPIPFADDTERGAEANVAEGRMKQPEITSTQWTGDPLLLFLSPQAINTANTINIPPSLTPPQRSPPNSSPGDIKRHSPLPNNLQLTLSTPPHALLSKIIPLVARIFKVPVSHSNCVPELTDAAVEKKKVIFIAEQ
ncbi:Hypothetical predicted protein [Podarcis lilfordi]|uniref:Uncharacterized protein n=1 Tax=Podarcis lilfordi TaxID=74358 RepID=A0AA35VWC6_9SAUR|nr:Hypothetical predicted protein [Podarcis lilfordi]